jgi:hypothetical protein
MLANARRCGVVARSTVGQRGSGEAPAMLSRPWSARRSPTTNWRRDTHVGWRAATLAPDPPGALEPALWQILGRSDSAPT